MYFRVIFPIISAFVLINCPSEGRETSCAEKEKSLAALDLAKESISKAKKLYPNCNDGNTTLNASVCGKKEKSLGYMEVALNLIAEAKKNYPTCPPSKPQILHQKPMDCSDVLENGERVSGVYAIWPKSRISENEPLDVFCDMDTDGGGWTVIQRRGNFSKQENFYRDWEDYKNGFGIITRDFWIGNEKIFALSNQGHYSIRFDMQDVDQKSNYSLYQSFWIEDEKSNYKLHISNYSGEAGHSMDYQNNMMFSTKDRKNDVHTESCANLKESGWWFKKCHYCNPNGLYRPGIRDTNMKLMLWYAWKEFVGLATMEMKLRRVL